MDFLCCNALQGRKSRRERRAFKERRMKNRLPSPPRYDDDDHVDDVDVFVMAVVMTEAKMYSLLWLRGTAVERRRAFAVLRSTCS